MALNEEVDALRNLPLFARVAPAKLKLIAFASKRLTFPEGHELFRQGEPGDVAYIVLEGGADVVVEAPEGEVTVARLGKNDIIGEMAILMDAPRSATVRATSRLETLEITKELFFRMVEEFPEIAVGVMRELAQRLDATNAQLRGGREEG